MVAGVPILPRVSRKAALTAAEVLARPASSSRLVGRVMASGQPRMADAIALSAQWLVVQRLLTRNSDRQGITLLDEGVIQTLFSIGLRGQVEGLLAALRVRARDWVRPALLVVVDVPVTVAVGRLRARASRHSRSQLLGIGEMERELHRGRNLLAELVAWWATLPGGGEILRVETVDHEQAGEAGARVSERLEAMLA